jgi:hypothetical protein
VAEELKHQSWWHTVPGFLTAAAAIITAVTGLILALQQTGMMSTDARTGSPATGKESAAAAAIPQVETPATAAGPTKPPAGAQAIEMPDGNSVTLSYAGSYRFRYTVQSAQRESISPSQHLLRFRIRVWTDFPAGVLFSSDSFRLYSGDLRLKPSNSFNRLVARDETSDGDVEFEADSSITEASLAITYASDPKQIRLVIP